MAFDIPQPGAPFGWSATLKIDLQASAGTHERVGRCPAHGVAGQAVMHRRRPSRAERRDQTCLVAALAGQARHDDENIVFLYYHVQGFRFVFESRGVLSNPVIVCCCGESNSSSPIRIFSGSRLSRNVRKTRSQMERSDE